MLLDFFEGTSGVLQNTTPLLTTLLAWWLLHSMTTARSTVLPAAVIARALASLVAPLDELARRMVLAGLTS